MAEVYAGFLSHADDADRPAARPPRGDRPAGQHDDLRRLGQRRQRRGRPRRLGQREQVLQRRPRRPRRRTSPCSTSWAARRRTTTTRPAGRWRSTPRSRCGSGTRSTAAPATRASSPGRPGSPPAARSAHQYHHAIDLVPTVLECLGFEQPAAVRGVTQIPIQGVSMSSSFAAPPTRRRRGRRSSTRCWAPAGSGTTAGRPSPPTRRSAAGATTSRTPGSSTTSTTTAPSCTTWPREQPERLAELIGLWFYEAGVNHAFPLDDRSALEIILTPAAAADPAARPLRLPARRRRDPRVRRGQRPQPRLHHRRPGRPPGRRGAGRPLRARQPVRRARALRQGQPAALRQQLRRRRRAAGRRHRGPAHRERPDPVRELRQDGRGPAGRRATAPCRSTTATARSARAEIRTQPGFFSLAGEGLTVGRDSGEAVTDDYPGTAPWRVHRRHPAPGRRRRLRRALPRPRARGRGDARPANDRTTRPRTARHDAVLVPGGAVPDGQRPVLPGGGARSGRSVVPDLGWTSTR